MSDKEKIELLEKQVKQLQVDKIELIRSTSTEIERLRQIIRTLSNPQAFNFQLGNLEYAPLSVQEKNKLSPPNKTSFSMVLTTEPNSISNPKVLNGNIYDTGNFQTLHQNNTIYDDDDNNNSNSSDSQTDANEKFLTKEEEKSHKKEDTLFRLNTKRMSYKGFEFGEFGDFGFMTTDFDQLSRGHSQWVNQVTHHPVQNGIVITASDDWCVMFWRFRKAIGNDELKQEKLNSVFNKEKKQNDVKPNASNNYYIDPKLQHIVGEIDLLPVFKINTGLEVKAIGMSSDGCILACTCYDEEEGEGNPELQLYFDNQQNWTFKHHQSKPNFGNMNHSNSSQIKEKNQNYDSDKQNEMKQNNNRIGFNKINGRTRLISKRVIPLPFEPIPHCICFSRDNKYVFIAMYSSIHILQELDEKLKEEYEIESLTNELRKWPNHPISLCCVNVETQQIMECEKIWKYLKSDEHVSCMSISPNGARIAIGTSLGQLIVTGVANLTCISNSEDEEELNPLLSKIWSSEMLNQDINSDQHIFSIKKQTNIQSNLENEHENEHENESEDEDGSVTSIDWSPDSDWIVCGYASGVIKFWEKSKERRLSVQMNKTIKQWMGVAKVNRKNRMFECKCYLDGVHIEAINSLSIRGSLMVSGADDGNVVIHDLLETFIHSKDPITIGKIEKIHGGRMVNSVCLTKNYTEQDLLLPSNGYFMVTSGADNIVHCVSLMDVCRESLRNKYFH